MGDRIRRAYLRKIDAGSVCEDLSGELEARKKYAEPALENAFKHEFCAGGMVSPKLAA